MNFLGVMYENGYSVPVNYETAVSWYLKAVETNNYYSFGNMALLYERGLGVKKSKKIAREWRDKQATLAVKTKAVP